VHFKKKYSNACFKAAVGTSSLILASSINIANAGNVKGFGEDNLQNNSDPTFNPSQGTETFGLRVPATGTTVTITGYVRGDFRYDDSNDLGDSFVVSSIPADGALGDLEDGHTRLHARQSRFIVRSETELDSGSKLKTVFEGDFFGAGGNQTFSNSSAFRLRNAYASYNGWLIGQTWTNFMDFIAYPTTVDFFGPAGKSFARQGQVRYTFANGLSFSIENPETDGFGLFDPIDGVFNPDIDDPTRLRESTGGLAADILPDFTAAWRGGPGGAGGSYEISGVARVLGIDTVIPNAAGDTFDADGNLVGVEIDEEELGFGVNLAGGWQFGPVFIGASFTAGDGIGRYIINGAGNDIFITEDLELETVQSMAFSANVKINWSSNSSSLLAFGSFENDEPAQSNGIDNLQTIHLNYIWNPFPKASFGVELIQGFIENADGSEGDATRFAFGAQLNF